MDIVGLARIIETVGAKWSDPDYGPRAEAAEATLQCRNRFTEQAIAFAINQQVNDLLADDLVDWATRGSPPAAQRRVGVINPGNVPFVELHDFLAVVLSGHSYLGKLSSRSPHLLPAFVKDLRNHGAVVDARFSTEMLAWSSVDALIGSGSDETMASIRQMADEAGIPADNLLLRGHRFSVAILGGNESPPSLQRLAEDILLHEGLGCRSVSLVWAPRNESPDALLNAMAQFRGVFPPHADTIGSLKIEAAFYRASELPHATAEDGSFLVSRGSPEPQRPGHLRWSEYENTDQVREWIRTHQDRIQLVVVTPGSAQRFSQAWPALTPAGDAQRPALRWSPGGSDTMLFLHRIR